MSLIDTLTRGLRASYVASGMCNSGQPYRLQPVGARFMYLSLLMCKMRVLRFTLSAKNR